MPPKKFVDLTSEADDEDYRRYGVPVARQAFALLQQAAPELYQLVEADSGFVVNLYGDDLNNLVQITDKYLSGGQRLAWAEAWLHPGAGPVVTLAMLVPDGQSAKAVMMKKLGLGQA